MIKDSTILFSGMVLSMIGSMLIGATASGRIYYVDAFNILGIISLIIGGISVGKVIFKGENNVRTN